MLANPTGSPHLGWRSRRGREELGWNLLRFSDEKAEHCSRDRIENLLRNFGLDVVDLRATSPMDSPSPLSRSRNGRNCAPPTRWSESTRNFAGEPKPGYACQRRGGPLPALRSTARWPGHPAPSGRFGAISIIATRGQRPRMGTNTITGGVEIPGPCHHGARPRIYPGVHRTASRLESAGADCRRDCVRTWEWKQANGALCDMVCRALLLMLHRGRRDRAAAGPPDIA